MKQEDKELLLKDLSARLPYGVMISYDNGDIIEDRELGLGTLHDFMFNNAKIKPYLRPMSSMTKEEKIRYKSLCKSRLVTGNIYEKLDTVESIDYLNSHHFDYRGLIEKGLAIEVTEENNPYKNE